MGLYDGSQFLEDGVARILAETRCSTEERDNSLHVYCIDVGDVDVVCDFCYSPLGNRKGV